MTTTGAHAVALREAVSDIERSCALLGEAELAALQHQTERLQALLHARSRELRRGREVVIKGPSSFGLLTDVDQLDKIIDLLDDVEALCLALVCKAFNHSVRRGRRKRMENLLRTQPVGIERHVRALQGPELGRLLSSPARLQWAKSLGLEYNGMMTDFLAHAGELRALQMVVADGCPWGDCAAIWAAGKGNLDTLRWATAHGCSFPQQKVCEWAATIDNALETGAPRPDRTVLAELHQRALAVICWAMDGGARCTELCNAPTSGADCGGIFERAAGSGNVPVLRWLATHGGLREGGMGGIYRGQTIEQLWTNALAAPSPFVEATVDCLREFGVAWHASASAGAAGPDLSCIRRLLTQIDRKLIRAEDAKLQLRSDLSLLRRLREAGCPWDAGTCAAAARAGNLEVLQFARMGGCDWDERVVAGAVSMIGTPLELPGHRETLQWALERGCPRGDESVVMMQAADRGNVEMLTLLCQHGFAVMPECLIRAATKGHLDCLKWIMRRFEQDGMHGILHVDGKPHQKRSEFTIVFRPKQAKDSISCQRESPITAGQIINMEDFLWYVVTQGLLVPPSARRSGWPRAIHPVDNYYTSQSRIGRQVSR